MEKKIYGKISEGAFVLRIYVGTGTLEDGAEFELAHAPDGSPFIIFKQKAFHLSWNEIIELASIAGLFR